MTNYVYVAASLDGFIATKDNGLDWLNEVPNPEQSDFGFAAFMKQIDAVVMGRNTFEQVLSFGVWPYTKPLFVLSHHLQQLPKSVAKQAFLEKGEVSSLVKRLHDQGFHNLYVDGGKTIQSFLQKDLIDQLTVTTVPILLGDGIKLFGKLAQPLRWKHLSTEVLNNTLVKNSYSRLRENQTDLK